MVKWLIIFQDALELVNSLGSAKKTHKVVAVANMPTYVRSNTGHMSLALLCKENDLKLFESAKVFSKMLQDLKDMEENGIIVDGEVQRI